MTGSKDHKLILSIFVTTRGFAFTLFEGAHAAVDWGTKEYQGAAKNARCIEAIGELLARYRPHALVMENPHDPEWRRADRIAELYMEVAELAKRSGVSVYRYDRAQIIGFFRRLGVRTKQQRASLIGKQVPAFAYKVPPPRRLWMSVHPRMGIFEAAALALTHFQSERGSGGNT